MATTLQTYVTGVQRLLHDTSAQFWPVAELTDYINEGRSRIAQDSKALRILATSINLTAGQELYNVVNTVATSTIVPAGWTPIDVMGISVYWGNSRYKMDYRSFSELDAQARAWQLYQERPVMFTRMGALQIYVAPIPDQNYVTDWDVAFSPPPLVNLSDSEVIPAPFIAPVKYYAASRAKFKEQQLGEVEIFLNEYKRQGLQAARSFQTRVLPNPYAY